MRNPVTPCAYCHMAEHGQLPFEPKVAVRAMLRDGNGPPVPPEVLLEPELVLRDSIGPAPSALPPPRNTISADAREAPCGMTARAGH